MQRKEDIDKVISTAQNYINIYNQDMSDFNQLKNIVTKYPVAAITIASIYNNNKDQYTQDDLGRIRLVINEINNFETNPLF